MKVTMRKLALTICLAFMLTSAAPALAGPPLVMLDGAGGVGANPTAWITGSTADTSFLDGWVQKPSAAVWYGFFNDIDTEFTGFGFHFGIKNRVELSWGRQIASVGYGPLGQAFGYAPDIVTDSFGCKVNLIQENQFGAFMPAISVGATYRCNHDSDTHNLFGAMGYGDNDDGVEFYAVASKVVTQLGPIPLIFSTGFAYTDAQQRGVFGFNDDEDIVFMFDFAAVVPLFRSWDYLKTVVPGFEYRQGVKYDDGYEDEDIWDIFFDFMVTDKIIIAVGHLWNGSPDTDGIPLDNGKFALGSCFFFMVDIDF